MIQKIHFINVKLQALVCHYSKRKAENASNSKLISQTTVIWNFIHYELFLLVKNNKVYK